MIYIWVVVFSILLTSCESGGTESTSSPSYNLPMISLERVDNPNMPELNHMNIAQYNGYWLIIGGSTSGFHSFSGSKANNNIYVYNPTTQALYFESIGNTNLPESVQQQIVSLAPMPLQDGDTFYLVGGYYNESASFFKYTTLDTISSFNVPGMINAIMNNNESLAMYVHSSSNSNFKSTGGELGQIGSDFYLSFGQDCEGLYCITSETYTNSVIKFSTTPSLESINIEGILYRAEGAYSGFRRRDYTLVPFIESNIDVLLALGGPFTAGLPPKVWTNVISINGDLSYNNNFLNQQANQYRNGFLSMHSVATGYSYLATFSGISTLYWDESGNLNYNANAPFGNILELISYDGNSHASREYANLTPLCVYKSDGSCVYVGADADFVPVNDNNIFDNRGILNMDAITKKTLVGYLYGGIVADTQSVFFTGGSNASNYIFAVYVTPPSINGTWKDITNMESGTPFIPD